MKCFLGVWKHAPLQSSMANTVVAKVKYAILCASWQDSLCRPGGLAAIRYGLILRVRSGQRIDQITKSRGIDSESVLKSIHVAKVYNSSHLELIVKDIGKYIEQFNARILIIDSILSLHRAEFIGRGTLAERQQRLNALMHRLTRVSEIYNIATVVTNQVQLMPATFSGDTLKPVGGNVIGHASTYRIQLRRSGSRRIARVVDSQYHPYTSDGVGFVINEKGVTDGEDKDATI